MWSGRPGGTLRSIRDSISGCGVRVLMENVIRNCLIICVYFVAQSGSVALADWIDFQDTNVSESEGVGELAVTLVRTNPTADEVFAYLSLQDISTDSGDYEFDPASIDRDFNSPSFDHPSGNSPGAVQWIREYADGRLLVGGDWDTVNGITTPHILRLLPGGTVDQTFLVNLPNDGRFPNDGQLLDRS